MNPDLGYGVFETLYAAARPFRLDAHMDRMREGLRALGLETSAADAARDAVLDSVTGEPSRIRVQARAVAPWDGPEVQVTAVSQAVDRVPRDASHVRVTLAGSTRPRKGTEVGVKSLSFAPMVAAYRQARAAGFEDALLRNDAGRICESTRANVIAIGDGVACAPGRSEGALPGITRGLLVDWLREMDYHVNERLDTNALGGAEVWLTNTTQGIRVVTAVDDAPTAPARLAPKMQACYAELVAEETS